MDWICFIAISPLLFCIFIMLVINYLIDSFNKENKKTINIDYVKKLEEEVDKDILNYYIKIIDFINNSDKYELKIRFSNLSYISVEKSSNSYYRVYLKIELEEYSEKYDFKKEDFLTNDFLRIFYKAMEEFKKIEKNKNNMEQKINQFKDIINIIDELSSKTPLKKEVNEFQNIQDNKVNEIASEVLDKKEDIECIEKVSEIVSETLDEEKNIEYVEKEIFYFRFTSREENGLVQQLIFIEEYSEEKARSKILHYFLDCCLDKNKHIHILQYSNFIKDNFPFQIIKYSKEEFIKYLENKQKWNSEYDKDYKQKMDKLMYKEASIYYLNGKIDKLSNYLSC